MLNHPQVLQIKLKNELDLVFQDSLSPSSVFDSFSLNHHSFNVDQNIEYLL